MGVGVLGVALEDQLSLSVSTVDQSSDILQSFPSLDTLFIPIGIFF